MYEIFRTRVDYDILIPDLGIDPEEAEGCGFTQSQAPRPSQQQPDSGILRRIAHHRIHVLPSMGSGRIVGVSKTVPHSDVKMFQSYR